MTNLGEWYSQNETKIKELGFTIEDFTQKNILRIDGEIGGYMFRIFDRGIYAPDIEIMNIDSGEVIFHELDMSDNQGPHVFDLAIDFMLSLTR